MHNCIFTAHCTESVCDNSCPMLVETSYLLERNNIHMRSPVFHIPKGNSQIDRTLKMIQDSDNKLSVIVSNDTVSCAEIFTYCAICLNWPGSRLHCNVYNLKYSAYLEELKHSWTTKVEPESVEYMKIWSSSAKVLIISNIDYVNFGDFESQTLLNLLQTRENTGQTTIIVSPEMNSLVGKSTSIFFTRLREKLSKAVIKW